MVRKEPRTSLNHTRKVIAFLICICIGTLMHVVLAMWIGADLRTGWLQYPDFLRRDPRHFDSRQEWKDNGLGPGYAIHSNEQTIVTLTSYRAVGRTSIQSVAATSDRFIELLSTHQTRSGTLESNKRVPYWVRSQDLVSSWLVDNEPAINDSNTWQTYWATETASGIPFRCLSSMVESDGVAGTTVVHDKGLVWLVGMLDSTRLLDRGVPTRVLWRGMITNSLIWGTSFYLITAIYLALREHRRAASSRCSQCGYSLDGLASSTCPECGSPLPSRLSDRPLH